MGLERTRGVGGRGEVHRRPSGEPAPLPRRPLAGSGGVWVTLALIVIAIFFCAQILGVPGVLLAIPWLVFFRQFWIDYVQDAFLRL